MSVFDYELDVRLQLQLFFRGLVDSLSFHRTLPDLVNNPVAAAVLGKILVANGVLILGSIVLFHKGIVPFLDVVGQSAFDMDNQDHYDGLLWFVYRWLWLGPICVLCYICCLSWYSELGESLKKKVPQPPKPMDQLSQGLQNIYALIVWVVAFMQLQVVNNAVPSVLHSVGFVVEKVFSADLTATASVSGQALALTRTGLQFLLQAASFSNSALGWLLMTTLYAWYCFDPIWIAQAVNPDERFSRIHKHLAYFLGFGIPYTVLLKNTSFFIGFASFLMVFPLSVILGSVSDYAQPYKDYEVKPVARLSVFYLAQVWTLYLLKPFNRRAVAQAKEGRASVTKSAHEVKLSRSEDPKKNS